MITVNFLSAYTAVLFMHRGFLTLRRNQCDYSIVRIALN